MEYFYLFFITSCTLSIGVLLPPLLRLLRQTFVFVENDLFLLMESEKEKLKTQPSSLAPFSLLLLLRPPAVGRLVGVDVGNGRTEARSSSL